MNINFYTNNNCRECHSKKSPFQNTHVFYIKKVWGSFIRATGYCYIYWLTVTHCAMHGTCHVQVTSKGMVGREVRSWPTCRGTVPAFA